MTMICIILMNLKSILGTQEDVIKPPKYEKKDFLAI